MDPCDSRNVMTFDYSELGEAFSRLSKPAQRALINNGILTPLDLAGWTRKDVAKLHGIGPSVFPKLDEILATEGLTFK
jgi:hypothetical protein